MPYLMHCMNKGCYKEQVPLLDVKSNLVMCSECNKEILNVTEFAKRSMKSLGQVTGKIKKGQTFAVKCGSCNQENTPVVEDDELVCPKCHTELQLSVPFANMLRSVLKP